MIAENVNILILRFSPNHLCRALLLSNIRSLVVVIKFCKSDQIKNEELRYYHKSQGKQFENYLEYKQLIKKVYKTDFRSVRNFKRLRTMTDT